MNKNFNRILHRVVGTIAIHGKYDMGKFSSMSKEEKCKLIKSLQESENIKNGTN